MYTVLEKYHQVPNGLEDLKSQFHFLTEATSKNVENLQQAINLQQTYSTALCGHVNVIFLRLTKIETEIQNLAEIFKTNQDNIQIDALDFDPDIDGPDNQWVHHTTAGVSVHELLSLPHPETADASFPEEGIADRDQFDTRNSTSEDSHRPGNLPEKVLDHLPTNSSTGPHPATATEYNISDEIPQIEEEDWENGQFADADITLIDRHNTHVESERIQKEYAEHLLDLTDNSYYSEEYPSVQLQYSIPDPDYYGPQPQRSHTHKNSCDPTGYYSPPLDPADVQCWHARGRRKCAY